MTSIAQARATAQALLDGAIAYARQQGATLIEAYPVDKPGRPIVRLRSQ